MENACASFMINNNILTRRHLRLVALMAFQALFLFCGRSQFYFRAHADLFAGARGLLFC